MVDIVEPVVRSRMMSTIRGKHTQPELAIRRYLHSCGYRFRLHRADLPGRPDLVLTKYRLVIFVHGCFWHRHSGCFYATSPATRKEFWQAKLNGNAERDQRHISELAELGWRTLVIWECGLKHSLSEIHELPPLIDSEIERLEWPVAPPRIRGEHGRELSGG
ncbi:very short patch repair endonuclease [Pseudomonas sp. B1-22]|uniref:very short patch repair endonuclease n=1 Tax=Pseudomonas sp. B1-22 TaxID=3141456 RepID=UPI003D2AC2B0